jgi:2,3-bisphosphoglycerate-dependent phosphoglycerate mutase
LGYQQLEALKLHFAHIHLDAIYSSDLGRAFKTATVIGEPHRLSIQGTPLLRERSFGIFEGMLRSEAKEKAPESYEAWSSGTFGEVVPGGESRKTLCERVLKCLKNIVQAHPNQSIAVVTHGGVLGALWRVLEPERPEARGFNIPNASISRFQHLNDQWQVLEWSNTDHLLGLRALDDGDNVPSLRTSSV